MTRWLGLFLLPVMLCLPALSATTYGAEITFYFQGALTQDGTLPAACGGFQASGTTLSGSFTFETDTPDLHPAPEQAIHVGAIVASALRLGAVQYTHATDGSMQFQDGYNVTGECGGAPHDQLNFSGGVASGACSETFLWSITRVDCSGTLLDTAMSMSTTPPGPSFMPFSFRLTPTGGGESLIGSVLSMSLEPPSPVVKATWGRIKGRVS